MAPIGILGGTFDPVHCGHLRLALEVREQLGLGGVRLIPAPRPRLRGVPRAGVAERLNILTRAVEGLPGVEVDDREIGRPGPTATVDTLRALRAELPEAPLCLVLGMDSFARLDEWERWTEICDLAHIAVATRPGAARPTTGPVADLLTTRETRGWSDVHRTPAGRVVVVDIPQLDISATGIRERLASGRSIRCLVPDPVHDLITEVAAYRHAQ